MFKKKIDPEKEKLRRKLQKHAQKIQEEQERRKKRAQRLLDDHYVKTQLAIQQEEQAKLAERQRAKIKKSLDEIKKTDLHQFRCHECGALVDMQNLTCPNCGQLYCQWCGAKMDMENPGICPRCGRPPMYTPAELVVTKVEDLAPEDRFWEELPTCPKCGATVQPDWPDCPICGAKLEGLKASSAEASATPGQDASIASETPAAAGPGDVQSDSKQKGRRKPKKKKKRGI